MCTNLSHYFCSLQAIRIFYDARIIENPYIKSLKAVRSYDKKAEVPENVMSLSFSVSNFLASAYTV